ncbi:eCIS core domain-containing protein [Nostoc sp.]|uniref:eCIS core domain-containing protein n=1 Tax=Nostoc sp. TaxID=1180 RepID=UPI002FF5EBB3
MHNKRLSKTPSSINSNSQAAEQNPKLAYRPFGSQIQKASAAPVTQSTKEDVAFAEQKMEAFGLELQAKYGKITPEGQERLTVLQAKMNGLLNSQLEHARRFSHNIANIPLRRPDTPTPIQAKLTIGEPGDKYEQEADETARQVVQRIHQPQSDKHQRESLPEEEDELQMKPSGNIQRESLPDEEELQMKPMVQRRVSNGGVAATQDLEASINQARGGGQPLAKNIREPMEQAFGANFSRVKVHTDTQADQLNRAIQAKAFTTGQDVFFRQGAYEPGSRGGQELLAHELTHVVQQKGGEVQRAQLAETGGSQTSDAHIGASGVHEENNKGAVVVQQVQKELLQKVSDIQYGSMYNNCGRSVDAYIDASNVPTGKSPPSSRPNWWSQFKGLSPGIKYFSENYLVQGHLLNHHVGGGDLMKNLTPITGSANTTMLNFFERTVKNSVKQGKDVLYNIQAAYHYKKPPTAEELAGKNLSKNDKAILNKSGYLSNFCDWIYAEYTIYPHVGGRSKLASTTPISASQGLWVKNESAEKKGTY